MQQISHTPSILSISSSNMSYIYIILFDFLNSIFGDGNESIIHMDLLRNALNESTSTTNIVCFFFEERKFQWNLFSEFFFSSVFNNYFTFHTYAHETRKIWRYANSFQTCMEKISQTTCSIILLIFFFLLLFSFL